MVRDTLEVLVGERTELAAGVLGLDLVAAGGGTLPAAAPGAPNVLLIVLDTVRADRLSLYGYGRDTTPNLVRLARRGVVFERARAAAPRRPRPPTATPTAGARSPAAT